MNDTLIKNSHGFFKALFLRAFLVCVIIFSVLNSVGEIPFVGGKSPAQSR
jgi:hypothetical protein